MKRILDSAKVRRIIIESGIVPTEEKLSDPDFLSFLNHEFRFLSKGDYFANRAFSLFDMLKINGLDLSNSKILDIGCGDCLNIFLLKKEYKAEVIGVDIQKSSLVAKKLIKSLSNVDLDIRLISSDPADLENALDHKKFDIIFLLDLVEHLEDPASYLIHLKANLLNEKGYLVVLFPPYYSSYGGHYDLPYLQYLPSFIRKILSPDHFEYREYGLYKLTVRKFEKYLKNDYYIVDKRTKFLNKVSYSWILNFICKLPFLREVLFSWVYILQKK